MPQKHQIIWLIHLCSYPYPNKLPYHRQWCPYSFIRIIPHKPHVMSELIDETPEVRIPICNGISFMLTEVATIHNMPQKHLATFPTVLTILSLKDILHNPFHSLFKLCHSQLLNHIVILRVRVRKTKFSVCFMGRYEQKIIIHHLPQPKPLIQIMSEIMGKQEYHVKLSIRNRETIF